jgi:tetratricopeptide (TPR) repeat protein
MSRLGILFKTPSGCWRELQTTTFAHHGGTPNNNNPIFHSFAVISCFKKLAMLYRLSFTVAISLLLFACRPNDEAANHLGVVEFKVTGKKSAQPFFEKGLLLLHSFQYDDAAESFREAIHHDTNFVMAYWGEAMTQTHALWRHQDADKAKAILIQLDSTDVGRVNKAVTPLEKDFIRAINILYGPGKKAENDSNYAVFMGKLHEQYPANDEVTAFYSIALLGSVQVGRNDAVYEHAAQMAKEVLAHNPNHPGALHYLIHAYDDPKHASNAVLTADTYAKVAPDAAHALHMPTHIYLALGMWDKVISSNIAAWEASRRAK